MTESVSENRPLPLPGAIVASLLCISFGANAVAAKISLLGVGTFTAAGIRMAVASVVIAIWAIVRGHPLKIKREMLGHVLAISAISTIQIGLFYLGIDKTNASRSTLLSNLQPFFVLLLAHFFIPGDQITFRKTLGILLGFGGVVFLFLEDKNVTSIIRTGDSMVIVATMFWACNAVYTKKIIADVEPFQLVLYPLGIATPFLLLAGLLWDRPMVTHIDLQIFAALAYQSLVTASFGFVLWNTLLKKYGAVALHSYVFIMPIAGVILGGILLKEPVTTFNIVFALFFIVIGIIVVHSTGKRRLSH